MELRAKLRRTLQKSGHSITKTRIKTFEALITLKQPITVVELTEILNDVDKASVYRSVELFEKVGIVHKVWAGFKSKIELSDTFSNHHHHFNCILCGNTESIKSNLLENSLHNLEAGHGFQLLQHSVELSGYCKKCLSSQ